jgi:hypothetical protein
MLPGSTRYCALQEIVHEPKISSAAKYLSCNSFLPAFNQYDTAAVALGSANGVVFWQLETLVYVHDLCIAR